MAEPKLYRPSNGTESQDFMEAFCFRCEKDRNRDCPILAATFVLDVNDPKYPKEWRYDGEGHPTCTAFESKR
jgi:hypothetical protein